MCDGNIVFQGAAPLTQAYFGLVGYTNFSKYSNPADNAMKVLAIDYPKNEAMEKKIQTFTEYYEKNLKGRIMADAAEEEFDIGDSLKARTKAGCCLQFKTLAGRNFRQLKRNPLAVRVRIG